MQIIHKIDDFLNTLFPELEGGGGCKSIIYTLENYYTYGPFKPKVSIEDGFVKIEIDTSSIIAQEADYKKTVALCHQATLCHGTGLPPDVKNTFYFIYC